MTWVVGRTPEKFVNHVPRGSLFTSFSCALPTLFEASLLTWHPAGVACALVTGQSPTQGVVRKCLAAAGMFLRMKSDNVWIYKNAVKEMASCSCKVDDIKIKRNVSLLFHHSLIFLYLLSSLFTRTALGQARFII